MKLSSFILAHLENILQEWEDFASTLEPLVNANKKELRGSCGRRPESDCSRLGYPAG